MDQTADPARRVLASIIDGTVIFTATTFISVLSLWWEPHTNSSVPTGILFLLGWLDLVVAVGAVSWVYSGILGKRALCLGHLICRMRLVNAETGVPITSWRGALRAAPVSAPIVIGFALTPLVGYGTLYVIGFGTVVIAAITWLQVAASSQHRGWNDRLAGAGVVRR